MFRKKEESTPSLEEVPVQNRVTSILGEGINWKGEISGAGGLRIEGLYEGKIELDGLVIVDRKGRVESDLIKAETVIVAGAVRSDIQAKRVEIRSTGRVWGNVTAVRFSTEDGAYLRGKIQMEEEPENAPQHGAPDEDDDQDEGPVLRPKKIAG
jgi:cytoskeletal protein CcmA (bactofilin family)